jgi:predicted dehydrogenase
MRIAFVGCGYVFDIYMRTRWAHPELEICGVFDIDTARSATVSRHYGLHVYPSFDALLDDPKVEVVINLTSIRSHFDVTSRALNAGKHVYTEKPTTLDMGQTQELFDLAAAEGVVLTGAPCNLYTDTIATMWKAIRDGAIGKPVLVYAELDDNPAHLMQLEKVQSPTGAPFPYAEEFQEGCTVEHVAYHLVWLCAMFGPAVSVAAFSSTLVAHKTDTPLDPPDTPDLSVACLQFANGLSARITCSWVAPRDHRFRIIGEEGELTADNVFHDQSPLRLERFSRVNLAARKAYTVRNQPLIGRLFGVGGRRLKLLRRWKSHAVEAEKGVGSSLKHKFVSWLRRREIYAQDKFLGIAEMTRAIESGRPQPMPADFLIHLNELTLLIQDAGTRGVTKIPESTFAPFAPLPDLDQQTHDYLTSYRTAPLERLSSTVVEQLHKK